MAKPTGRDDPLFDDPTAYLFTDGSAVPNGPAGWGITLPSLALLRPKRFGSHAAHQHHRGT